MMASTRSHCFISFHFVVTNAVDETKFHVIELIAWRRIYFCDVIFMLSSCHWNAKRSLIVLNVTVAFRSLLCGAIAVCSNAITKIKWKQRQSEWDNFLMQMIFFFFYVRSLDSSIYEKKAQEYSLLCRNTVISLNQLCPVNAKRHNWIGAYSIDANLLCPRHDELKFFLSSVKIILPHLSIKCIKYRRKDTVFSIHLNQLDESWVCTPATTELTCLTFSNKLFSESRALFMNLSIWIVEKKSI